MKLIVGLGNPGLQYKNTRHNVGFMVIDELSEKLDIKLTKEKYNGLYGSGIYQGEKIILLKPLTYMNLSGESIKPLMNFYKLNEEDLLVIYDDLDLPTGKIRLRLKGSAGGHNGLKSIINHLGVQEFKRVRIGIDRPNNGMPITDYVLGSFGDTEKEDITHAITRSTDACIDRLTTPFADVMNQYNQ